MAFLGSDSPASLPCRSGGLLPYGLSWRVLSSELFSFDPNRPAWRHNKAEEHRRGQSCDDHADHIASSHRLRIVSNWQVDDSIPNNPGRQLGPRGARVWDLPERRRASDEWGAGRSQYACE